ncbi:hypothetical protein AGR1B_Cc40228 [Agrobacterium fabacearum S56]|nr:hypothetical protein AGR1B_Cc40228 [Agrobacterium fabacearum S56]
MICSGWYFPICAPPSSSKGDGGLNPASSDGIFAPVAAPYGHVAIRRLNGRRALHIPSHRFGSTTGNAGAF